MHEARIFVDWSGKMPLHSRFLTVEVIINKRIVWAEGLKKFLSSLG